MSDVRSDLEAGYVPGSVLERLRHGVRLKASSAFFDALQGTSPKDELSKYGDTEEEQDRFFLRSLINDPKVAALQARFVAMLETRTMSPLVTAAESETVELGKPGSRVSPQEIRETSQRDPVFRAFGEVTTLPTTTPSPCGYYLWFSYSDLALLFAAYHQEPALLRGAPLKSAKDGNIKVFASKVLSNLSMQNPRSSVLRAELSAIAQKPWSELEAYYFLLAKRLVYLPLGNYGYDFRLTTVSSLDEASGATHHGTLVTQEGLMVEIISEYDFSANAARPTSFVSFLERGYKKPEGYRKGIFYYVHTNAYSPTYLCQRGIQVIGDWKYYLLGQSCDTLAKWINENSFDGTCSLYRRSGTYRDFIDSPCNKR